VLTQCPECKTKFRVNDDQLRAAQGQVRCSRCHIIFNAREFLQSPSAKEGQQTPSTAPDSVTDFISDADLEEFSDLKAQVSNDLCPFEDSDNETLKKQPDRMIDEDLSEVLRELERHQAKDREQATSDGNSTDQAQTEADDPEQPLPFEVPENLEGITPASQEQLDVDGILRPKRAARSGGGWWTFGILTLLLLAISQLAWFGRDKLMRYPEGRILFNGICEYAGCKLPLIRAPEQIQVLSRSITTHPKIESALLIQLTIANNANFSQPYPILQIGLYSSDELLVVQRRFHPKEYIPGYTEQAEFAPGKALYVELAIEDPGRDVTGFQLEFF
jgi:predicted Zn finger-like uncharacterized protein